MNRIATFTLLLAVVACNKKKEDAPATAATPTPTAPAPSPATPPTTPTPVVPDPAPKAVEAAKPATPCGLTLHVAADRITVEGAATGQAKTPADLTATLNTVDHACNIVVGADDTITYQHVIDVFDRLTKDGFTDASLDVAGKGPSRAAPMGPDVKQMPVVTIAKTGAITVDGKQLGKAPLKPLLDAEQKEKPGTTFILQADASLPYKTVRDVISQASDAGFGNVLFAVKTK